MQIKFHWYGFIVGVAIVIAAELIQRKAKEEKISEKYLFQAGVFSLLFGVIGARVWHVVTDYWLYLDNLKAVFYIWNGGLSILGGVLGGIIGLLAYQQFLKVSQKATVSLSTLLDIVVFGLPVGQAVGRLANYFNQELYGIPTNGFFKIFIKKENRVIGYENIEYYHPLFLYELVFTASFAVLLYYFDKKNKLPQIGSGLIFLSYVFYYSLVRFFLDFLRIQRGVIVGGIFGFNQVILVFIMFWILFFAWLNLHQNRCKMGLNK